MSIKTANFATNQIQPKIRNKEI